MEITKYSLSIKTPVAKKKKKKERERQKCPKLSNNPSLFMFSAEESHLKWSWAIVEQQFLWKPQNVLQSFSLDIDCFFTHFHFHSQFLDLIIMRGMFLFVKQFDT